MRQPARIVFRIDQRSVRLVAAQCRPAAVHKRRGAVAKVQRRQDARYLAAARLRRTVVGEEHRLAAHVALGLRTHPSAERRVALVRAVLVLHLHHDDGAAVLVEATLQAHHQHVVPAAHFAQIVGVHGAQFDGRVFGEQPVGKAALQTGWRQIRRK